MKLIKSFCPTRGFDIVLERSSLLEKENFHEWEAYSFLVKFWRSALSNFFCTTTSCSTHLPRTTDSPAAVLCYSIFRWSLKRTNYTVKQPINKAEIKNWKKSVRKRGFKEMKFLQDKWLELHISEIKFKK